MGAMLKRLAGPRIIRPIRVLTNPDRFFCCQPTGNSTPGQNMVEIGVQLLWHSRQDIGLKLSSILEFRNTVT